MSTLSFFLRLVLLPCILSMSLSGCAALRADSSRPPDDNPRGVRGSEGLSPVGGPQGADSFSGPHEAGWPARR